MKTIYLAGGCFWGTQHKTGIYYADGSLLPEIEAVVNAEKRSLGLKARKFAVEIGPLENFYTAEAYHQKYLAKHPNGYCHIPSALFRLGKGHSVADGGKG